MMLEAIAAPRISYNLFMYPKMHYPLFIWFCTCQACFFINFAL